MLYPVKLAEFFKREDEQYEIVLLICTIERCRACGKRLKFEKAYAHHSIPHGYGEIWCRRKCMYSGKVAESDRRRDNRLKRKAEFAKSISIGY